jgi:uncharacterized protein YdhG (YjbR/CyaY superfamily)
MVQSPAKTVDAYIAELPEERRAVVKKVREVIRKNLPKGYEERMGFGMIGYCVPETDCAYAGLAAQKNYYSLYLMGCYMDPATDAALKAAFRKAGKKLDMGKSCVRFKSLDDLPLEAIGAIIARMPVDKLLKLYEKAHAKQ